MRRALLLIAFAALVAGLAACGGDDASKENKSADHIGLFDWNRDGSTIIVRLDSQSNDSSPAFALNSIPPCTLWGDGRLVWTALSGIGAEQVLEARLDDVTIRSFLEDIINRGFFTWEDELLSPSSTSPTIESVTVYLYDEVRTVRRFSSWPQTSYVKILENCRQLSSTPVLVMPQAGWVSAYAVPTDDSAPNWLWPVDAPFALHDLAQNGEARWLEGLLATQIWMTAREQRGDTQVLERDGSAFQAAIVVPGYSRDEVAPPPDALSGNGSS